MSLVFNDYEDDPSDLSITKAKSRNILIAGLTGSGKSSIIKSIISPDHDSPISKMSICSVTKNLALYGDNKIKDHSPDNKNAEYIVNLFDTVGLGDPEVDVPTILRQIVDATQTDLAKIHKVVFCFKMDRLRAKMSEDLNILYNFFKMVGAHPDNFVICLTFCDILNNETISAFWDELKVHSDLAMVKEVKNVTYTSFPNISECDTNPELISYLETKIRYSRKRIFENVVKADATAFYPHAAMLKMPDVEFSELCKMLQDYRKNSKWWWRLAGKKEEEALLEQVKKLRTSAVVESEKDGKKSGAK